MSPRPLIAVPLALVVAGALGARPPAVPPDSLPQDLPLESIPLGLGPRPAATDNPLTTARMALGRKLFFDPILSGDGTVTCASCHRPDHGFASSEARPIGIK